MGKKQHLLGFLDSCLSLFVFAPLVVGYWRGTWGILDFYQFSGNLHLTSSVSIAVGIGGSTIFYFLQVPLEAHLKKGNILVWIFFFHLYTYVFGFCTVNHWRGVWGLLDHYMGRSGQSGWITTAIGLGVLWSLRASKNCITPPVVTDVDTSKTFFKCGTRFGTKSRFGENYILDVLFTVAVIHSLVVFYWRGVWTILENYIFPHDIRMSALCTLAIGYGVQIISFSLQYITNPAYKAIISRNYPFICRVILEDMIYTIANFGTVCIWHGVWNCCNVFIFPNNPAVSNWLTHGVGIGGLMLCLNGNSVIVRGSLMDGEPSTYSEEGAVFPNEFFRYFFRKKPEELNCVRTQPCPAPHY